MTDWDYSEAFSRNRGLISVEEQEKLRNCRVAIAGMGGVGGIHMATLARLGIEKFTIADPDKFEVANFNRQYGATMDSVGQYKVDTMVKAIKKINPQADIRVLTEAVGPENVDAFLKDADIFIDGIDAFVIDARRLIYRKAAEKGIYSISAGPMGFSTAFLIFDPHGMSMDKYFDFHDGLSEEEKFIRFMIGLAPAMSQRAYLDVSFVDVKNHVGPSVGAACQLCAGVVGAGVVKILLKRGPVHPVPHYHQFDAYLDRYILRKLRGGNRHPLQILKRWILLKKLKGLKT